MVGVEIQDTLEQAFMAFADLEGAASYDLCHSSLFFEGEGQLYKQGFQTGRLPRQAIFSAVMLMDLNSIRRMDEQLVTPLVILGLADLMLVPNFCYGPALKVLTHQFGLLLRIPFRWCMADLLGCQPQATLFLSLMSSCGAV